MICRLAGYLRCAPSEVEELPAPDFDLLVRYYAEEPFGVWRDNLHAAMIAREVRRARWPNKRHDLSTWMIEDPEKRAAGHVTAFKQTLLAMAGGIRKHVSQAIKRPKRKKAAK